MGVAGGDRPPRLLQPANQILDLDPGEVFVHRNVANLVHPADANALTVIPYAVGTLGVRDIIVCGHYGCGGVQAVHEGASLDLLTDWLWPIRTVARAHAAELAQLDRPAAFRRLCELNVQEQVRNVADTSVLRAAWAGGQQVSVHGLVYGLEDGRLHDLDISITGAHDLPD